MKILQSIYNEASDSLCRKKNASEEYMAFVQRYGEAAERLQAALDEEEKELYFDMEAERNLLAAEDEEWMFQYGFHIGAKLILELLCSSDV